MNRLEKILQARELLKELGEYDTSIAGAVGEVYAEEILGMTKAPRGEAGYDGHINGRRVSVKTKESNWRTDSQAYAAIRLSKLDAADDLLVVALDENGIAEHLGPVPVADIEYYENKTERRYSLARVRRAAQ